MYGIEAVQKRPGMYVGDTTDGTGLHTMLFEVICNSINEGLVGHCNAIEVFINPDGSATVRDNGRGIPIDSHPSYGKSVAEVIFTYLHTSPLSNFRRSSSKHLRGVGLCVVNALSEKLEFQVMLEGKTYQLRFHQGCLEAPLVVIGNTANTQTVTRPRGTEITFLPNQKIFTNPKFEFSTIAAQLNDLNALGAGISISVSDLSGNEVNRKVFQV